MIRGHNPRHPRIALPPRSGRVPVAVLASRWHFNYEHYAAVLEVRAQQLLCDIDGATANVRETLAPATVEPEPATPGLRALLSNAFESIRGRRRLPLPPQAEISRAS